MPETTAHPTRSASGAELAAEVLQDVERPDPPSAYVQSRPDGRQLQIVRGGPHPEQKSDPDRARGDRRPCTGFSERSRRNLRRTVHGVPRSEDALFLTLTYHRREVHPDTVKSDLDAFAKRLRRKYGGEHVRDPASVWKLEPQQRGTPHYHFLTYNVPFIDAQWASEAWAEVTGDDSKAHEKSSVDIERVPAHDHGKLQGYLGKYFSKTHGSWPDTGSEELNEAWETPGRFWGVIGREDLPTAAWAERGEEGFEELQGEEATRLITTLLDRWDVDTDGVIPPRLTVNVRGDPRKAMQALLDLL